MALTIVRPLEPLPDPFTAAVYLAGPDGPSGLDPGSSDDPQGGVSRRTVERAGARPSSWREEVLERLAQDGFDGVVYLPEAGGAARAKMDAWEGEALRHADAVLFWLPTEEEAPGDLALGEQFGAWKRSGKVVVGGVRERAPGWFDPRWKLPTARSIEEAVRALAPLLRPGALRRGGERAVPLHLWRSPSFQRWYRALRASGNQLDDLDVEWSYRLRAPAGRPPLLWAVRPRVWVRRERRHKSGEVVVGRADVSATVLYHPGAAPADTLVVLVREFRSAGLNGTGYVWELPGGSAEHAADRDQDPRATAAREVQEETGLAIAPGQLEEVPAGARQVAATILCHRAHLYRARLSEKQLDHLRRTEREGRAHGANAGERCYVALRTLGQLLSSGELDWGQVGMILWALSPLGAR